MKSPCQICLLFALGSTHAWSSIDGRNVPSSLQLETAVRKDMHADRKRYETMSEQRIRLLWSLQPFEIANNLVNSFIQGTPTGLKRKSDEQDALADHLFVELFSFGPNESAMLQRISPPMRDSITKKKRSFALTIAYRGSEFCGWQTQPNNTLPSVQESLEAHLAILQNARVDIRVCGRTDAGVHAIGQVCRYRTERDVEADDVQRHLDQAPFSSDFRCLGVQRVPSTFHPGFGATCRAYAYVIDPNFLTAAEAERLDTMLRELENKTLDYYGFSYGKVKTQSTNCTLYCARATHLDNGGICIQLVGDRFLRRMVRLLVSTALSMAFDQASSSLIPRIAALDRAQCSSAAPPGGLIFVAANFEPQLRTME